MSKKTPQIRFKGFTDDWEERKFGELYKKVNEKNDLSFGKDRVISVANMYFKDTGNIRSDDAYMKTYNIFRMGDIAFEGNRSKHFSYGRFVENTIGDGIVSHVFDVFRPIQQFDLNYWKYAIHNERVMGPILMTATTSSTMMTNLVAKDFLKRAILVPSYSEQKLVGSFFKQLDGIIALHQRKLDLLKEQKKGFLQKMFPKNGSRVPELRFEGFSDDWEERKFENVVDVKSGKDYKHLKEGTVPVYGTGGYMLSVDKSLSAVDAIGIGRKGTIDKPYLLKAPFWTVDTLFYAIPKQNVDLQFSLAIFKKINWKKFDESTGVPSLSKSAINSVKVVVPVYEEQQKIGSFFKQLDDLITLHQRKLDILKKQKKGFLQKMFVS